MENNTNQSANPDTDTKKIVIGIIILIIFIALVSLILSSGSTNIENNKQVNNSNATQEAKIQYEKERRDALVAVQSYPLKIWLERGTKYQISKGTSLADLFKSYIDKGLINKDARWITLRDNDRYVVIFRSEFDSGNLNNPQWAVLPKSGNIFEVEIRALNGTAKKYTPELGVLDLSDKNKSKELTFYLKWEALMEQNNWDESKNQTNLDKVTKEYGVTTQEADRMFAQGEKEKNDLAKEDNNIKGDILSDEKVVELIKNQGDLYIPEN